MKNRYKPHLLKIQRMRTSLGRDLYEGMRLDRNERVTNFADHIIEQIYKSIPPYALNAYPDMDRLYKKLAAWTGVTTDEIYITNGITEGIRIVFETLINPGDSVLAISPTFPMYPIYGKIYQAEWHTIDFSKDLTIDFKQLCAAINNTIALVCLPNPNLPIENLFSPEQIKDLADICKKQGAALVVDEAYYYFGAKSVVPLIKECDNLVVFQTFSKALGLAGARIGYMMSNPENIEYLSKTRSLVEINGISAAIGEYILDHPKIMNDYVQEVEEGRKYVKNELKKLGIRYAGGNVTNGMLIFLQNKSKTESLLAELKKEKIYIRGSFEPPIDNCIRLTLGPKKEMGKFITALTQLMSVTTA